MVPTVRGNQGKLRKSEKVGEFYISKSGKIRGSGKVRENQSTRVQKLTKMQKKF